MASVSVVIVNYNGRGLLDELFSSLARQTRPADEVIMVDNASADDSVAHVRTRFPWVKVIVSPTNTGFAEGSNIGAVNAQSDYLALLNSDTALDERWLDELVRVLDADERVGAAVSKIYLAGRPPRIDCAGAEFNNLGFCWGRGANQLDRGQFESPEEVPAVTACGMLLRRAALDGEPLFDRHFFMYYEEFDLTLRLRGRGHAVMYVPTSVVYHKRAEAVKAATPRPSLFHLFYASRNRVKILARYYPAAVLLRSLPLILLSLAYADGVLLLKGGPGRCLRSVASQLRYALAGLGERLRGRSVAAASWLPWMQRHGLRDVVSLRAALGSYVQDNGSPPRRSGVEPRAVVTDHVPDAGRTARLISWVAVAWLAVMTGWYASTVGHSIGHSLNGIWEDVPTLVWKAARLPWRRFDGSWSGLWALAWVACVAAVLGATALVRGRSVAFVCLAMQSAIAVTMLVLSGQLTAALIAAWLLVLAWASADALLRRSGAEPSDASLEWTFVCLALGLVILMTLVMAMGLTRLLAGTSLAVVLAALTLLLRRQLRAAAIASWTRLPRRAGADAPPDRLPEAAALLSLLGFVWLANLTWALAPEVQFDALNYHLAVPRIYLAEHRLLEVPDISTSYLVRLADMLFTLALALHGPILAKLLMLSVGVITAIGVYVLGQQAFNRRVGLWAAALFYATPLVSWLSTTAYVDLTVCMMLLASLVAFLRWRKTSQTGWAWAAGLLAGAAVGAKMSALLGLPVIAVALLWQLRRMGSAPRWARAKALAAYATGALVVAGPWYALTYAFTGNPFFPFLNGIFKSPLGPSINWSPSAQHFGVGTSPLALLRLPLALTFESRAFSETLPNGGLGLATALLPLALLLLVITRTALVGWLLALCAVYVGLWAVVFQYGRYYVPVLPVVIVLAVGALDRLALARGPRYLTFGLLGAAFVMQAPLIPAQHWHIPERLPFRLALGLETPAAFLARALPPYPATEYVNRMAKPDQKVLGVGFENMRFYLNVPLGAPYGSPEVGRLLQEATSTPTGLAAALLRHGYTYMVVNESSPMTRVGLPYLAPAFLDRFATMEFASRGVNVYRVREAPGPAGGVETLNLLRNGTFESLDATGQPVGWNANGQARIARDGAQEGRIAAIANPVGTFTQLVSVNGGRLYTLGHFTRADRPKQFARLQINWLDAAGRAVGVSIEVVAAGPEWRWHQMSVNAPEQAATAIVFVSVHEASEVWFDDLWLAAGSRARPDSAPGNQGGQLGGAAVDRREKDAARH